jgi:Tol biopolymer transport system component
MRRSRDFLARQLFAGGVVLALVNGSPLRADAPPEQRIGYTELRTDLPGGRHVNVSTMRAVVVKADGTGRSVLAEDLVRDADSWTQFAGWSPDGKTAVVGRGWQGPEHARWEEEHKQFRFTKEGWLYDSYLVDLATGRATNVTGVDRVSFYNSGLFFWPNDATKLGFTALIDGNSHPFRMDRDGRNKVDLTKESKEFTYGFSGSRDGKRIAYHKNYQVYLADADGSNPLHVKTGRPFNFGPAWSPDGRWVLFLSGEHHDCHPHVVRADGTGLKKLADRGGYKGVVEFLDVPDFHGGSSDTPAWSADGQAVFYTAQVGKCVELFQSSLDGKTAQLTRSPEGTIHYHPQPSPDGRWLAYGSKRDGLRQLYVMNLADHTEKRVTNIKAGHAAMWPHWQPRGTAAVGLSKQLLVDDVIVAESSAVTRELGRVTKANGGKPVFTDGWFYGTVLRDEGRFKLWYRKPDGQGFGYAESNDGLAFEKKADLKGINFAGDFTLAVEIDSHEADPKHRFKAGYDAPGMAAGIARSADGITWAPYNDGKPVTRRAADTYNQVLWDPIARTYRLFTRTDFGTPGGATELRGTRGMTNPDLKANPTDWKLVREWIFDKDGKDEAKRRQVYAATCWIHEGVYFALLSVYEHPGDVSEGKTTDTSKRHERDVMNFYIATSRDGDAWDLHWVYAGRPLVPRGADGAFDKDLILPASTVVTHDDRHWIYYAGGNERHGTEDVRFDRRHAIGLATLPLDRFVALAAGEKPGTVVTRPFTLEGDGLLVNVDASAGDVSVEVLDGAGKPIAGYSGSDAASAPGTDDLRWRPRWKGQPDLARLRNQTVRFQFTLRQAKLYSFQVK